MYSAVGCPGYSAWLLTQVVGVGSVRANVHFGHVYSYYMLALTASQYYRKFECVINRIEGIQYYIDKSCRWRTLNSSTTWYSPAVRDPGTLGVIHARVAVGMSTAVDTQALMGPDAG